MSRSDWGFSKLVVLLGVPIVRIIAFGPIVGSPFSGRLPHLCVHLETLNQVLVRNYTDKTPLEYMQARFRRGFDEETPIAAWLLL